MSCDRCGQSLCRCTPLRRKTPLKRSSRVNPVNRKRRAERAEKQYGPTNRIAWVAALPCRVCGLVPSENAHATSRGAGGDYTDIVPLCGSHHREQHQLGIESFQEKYGIDLHEEARKTQELWIAQGGS